ncbi:nitroreductase family protein [Marinobacterium rhizophilum]|uniref:Nitroreductase family protein n=1 Tax=Marinobacterium rhizophilum TaxID=420402 RepID=A0ABY5HIH0_9GAMM|nr:nitroreductase family protein [Marinobacterium rhizophilum]UTW10776.1 nitroreductase family protein [Marinobacterium rhizophilum]
MSNAIKQLIESRVSTGRYDPARRLSEAEVSELVRLATRAPSAFNVQNWKFVAVCSPEAKARLRAAAFDQPQIEDAAVTFIVCGTLGAHKDMPRVLQPSVDAGIVPQTVADGWVEMATASHDGNPQLQRDEAFRSASLAAMTLMLAAEGMGVSTGAMSGFDAQAVAAAFELDASEVPVMLVTAGYGLATNWPQKPRRPLQEVMTVA